MKEIPTPVQLCFVQLANECQVQNPRARSLFSRPESIGDPINNNGSSSLTICCILFRQSVLLKSHFVKSRVIGHLHIGLLPRNCHGESYTHPPSPFQCRLSFHCYCCCCPRPEVLLDAPFASLTLPVVRRLRQSFRSPVPNSVLQVTVAQAVAQAATPNHCYCYLLPRAAQEVALLRPQGDVSCAGAPHPPVPWQPEHNDRVLVRDFRWSSTRLFPCGNGNVLNDPPLVYDLLLRWHTEGNLSVYPNRSMSVRRNGARRTCRNSGTNGGKGAASCAYNTGALIPTLPPSSSSACGVNSLPTASSGKLPVHRSPGGNRLIVRAFTTPLEVPTSTVFDASIGPKYLPCSKRESRRPDGGWMAAKAFTTLAHRTVPRGTARLPTFRSYAVLPSRPTANRRCMLAAYGTKPRQQIMVCWHVGT